MQSQSSNCVDLNASFTSNGTDNSFDLDTSFHIYNEPQIDPLLMAQVSSNYGFRTRHLSCIEENDSDLNSDASSMAPYDIMREADETFKKCMNDMSSWEDPTDTMIMLDESRIYSCEYFEKLNDSKTEGNSQLDYWQSITSEPVHKACIPNIMTTSCYGVLNNSSGSDEIANTNRSAVKLQNLEEPLYAVPKKCHRNNNATNPSLESSDQSKSSSFYGGGSSATEQISALTSSFDLKPPTGILPGILSENSTSIRGETTFEWNNDDDLTDAVKEKWILSTQEDLQSIRRLLEHETSSSVCPSCRISFDKGKRRKLIDTCGHERCYSCMFRNDQCPMCINSSLKDVDCSSNAQGYDTGIGGSTSTIVSPLGSPQPQLRSQLRTNAVALSKYMQNHRQESISSDFRYASFGKLPKSYSLTSSNAGGEATASATITTTTNGVGGGTGAGAATTKTSSAANGDSFGEITTALFATPPSRRRFFNHKNIRSALTGHRRTASNGCPIDTASIFSGENESIASERCATTNEKQKEELRARLGLLLIDGNGRGGVGTANSSSSANISPDQTLTGGGCNSDSKPTDYVKYNADNESTFGSHYSVTGKDDTFSLSCKLKSSSLADRENGLDLPKTRKSVVRRSARTGQQMNNAKNRNAIYKPPSLAAIQLALKPLFFEVPLQEPDPPFLGRQWLLRELSNVLTATETPGVLINGNPGTGKTALILQLVEYSCFGRRNESPSTSEAEGIYCQINIGHDRLKALASHIVGYHFCQADTNLTCLVPDFVHSLAAQLCQAPQLAAYRDYLLNEPHLQDILNVKECIADAERVMRMAILEPLTILKKSGKISAKTCLILVDALCEAEYHRPDHGHTIATFLAKMTQYFPSWLKVMATVRTQMLDFVKGLSYTKMTLDSWASNDLLQKDMLDYITFRVNHSANIQNNIAAIKDNNSGQLKFINHLQNLAKGSMLYAKLILDLIERGQLVIKSTSYKILPVSLAQIFLLHFNLRFPTASSFEKAAPILHVCLAALYPLTLNEIYYTVSAMKIDDVITWDEFLLRFKLLDGFLVKRIDNTYMFFHPSFREWLIRRDEGESLKFLCDFRLGHAAIAFRLSRFQAPLDAEQTLELGHHILKAHIYRNCQVPQTPRDMQSFWIASVTDNISASLGSLRNVYSPNLKVSRLLLLAGATPHYQTEFMGDATILCIAAYEGIVPMVSLLLEFGANVRRTNSQGCTPLILAAMRGHCDVVRLLVAAGSSLGQTDTTQRCALVHAARMGRLNVVKYLLACDWAPRVQSTDVTLQGALQQALIAAAAQNYTTILEDLLEMDEIDIDAIEQSSGDTALTAASKNGCVDAVGVLLSRGSKVDAHNKPGFTALWLSVKGGHWAVAEQLLQSGANINEAITPSQKTPLMTAAEEGHVGILELLIDRGASIEMQDHEGFTALSWACLRGRQNAAKCLVERGCNKNHADNNGRTALDLAAYQGSANLVQYLLEQGANIEHIDVNGMRPLDRSIACRNIQVVQVFLRRGAKLGPTTWNMAMGKPEILVVLLNKLLEDGNVLYRKNRFQDAAYRYQYALKKIANIENLLERNSVFSQLRANLLLNLSRCKRKLNELDESIDLATHAIEQKPNSYEGFYARAKAKMENGKFNEALADANEAMQKAAQNGVLPEVVDVLRRIQNELLTRITESNNYSKDCAAAATHYDSYNSSQSHHSEITDL